MKQEQQLTMEFPRVANTEMTVYIEMYIYEYICIYVRWYTVKGKILHIIKKKNKRQQQQQQRRQQKSPLAVAS